MSETIHPAEMTPDERLQEVTAILARAVLRLHMHGSQNQAERVKNPDCVVIAE